MIIKAYKLSDNMGGITYDLAKPYGMATQDVDVEDISVEISDQIQPTYYRCQINGFVTSDCYHAYNLQQAILCGLAFVKLDGESE